MTVDFDEDNDDPPLPDEADLKGSIPLAPPNLPADLIRRTKYIGVGRPNFNEKGEFTNVSAIGKLRLDKERTGECELFDQVGGGDWVVLGKDAMNRTIWKNHVPLIGDPKDPSTLGLSHQGPIPSAQVGPGIYAHANVPGQDNRSDVNLQAMVARQDHQFQRELNRVEKHKQDVIAMKDATIELVKSYATNIMTMALEHEKSIIQLTQQSMERTAQAPQDAQLVATNTLLHTQFRESIMENMRLRGKINPLGELADGEKESLGEKIAFELVRQIPDYVEIAMEAIPGAKEIIDGLKKEHAIRAAKALASNPQATVEVIGQSQVVKNG